MEERRKEKIVQKNNIRIIENEELSARIPYLKGFSAKVIRIAQKHFFKGTFKSVRRWKKGNEKQQRNDRA